MYAAKFGIDFVLVAIVIHIVIQIFRVIGDYSTHRIQQQNERKKVRYYRGLTRQR